MAPGFAGLFDNLRAPEHLCSLSGFFFENLSDPSPDRRSGASSQETLNPQPDFSFSGPGGGGFHGDSLNYLLFRPVPELSSRGFPFADDQPLLPDHLGGDPTLFFERWFSAKTLPADPFLQSLYGLISWRARWDIGMLDHFLRPPSTFIDVTTGASFVGIFLILGFC